MSSEKVSTSSETRRKSTKPLMEKRRRARFNASVAELKTLLMDAIRTEGTRASKMDKADILEMTVRHLRQLQRKQVKQTTGPLIISTETKYQTGFNECAIEISKFLGVEDVCNVELRTKILEHLADHVSPRSIHKLTTDCVPSPSPDRLTANSMSSLSPDKLTTIRTSSPPQDKLIRSTNYGAEKIQIQNSPSPIISNEDTTNVDVPKTDTNSPSFTSLSTSLKHSPLNVSSRSYQQILPISKATDAKKHVIDKNVTLVENDVNNNSMLTTISPGYATQCSPYRTKTVQTFDVQKFSTSTISTPVLASGNLCTGVQFIPSALSGGNMAIVIPQNMNTNATVAGYFLPVPVITQPFIQMSQTVQKQTLSPLGLSPIPKSTHVPSINNESKMPVDITERGIRPVSTEAHSPSMQTNPPDQQEDRSMWRPW